MIDIIAYKDSILRYLLLETEEQGASDLDVIFSDVEKGTNVPMRFVEEILLAFQRDGLIKNVVEYNEHMDLEVCLLNAYQLIQAGGYKAKQLIETAKLEKLDLELKALAKELSPDQMQKATMLAQISANVATVISSIKSFLP